jgi:hypothetical protein
MHDSLPFLAFVTMTFCATAVAQVSGTIVDDVGTPLGGAIITVQATTIRVTSAPDGTFSLPSTPAGPLTIVGAKKGFYNAPAWISSPATGVRLQCDPVVVGNDPSYTLLSPTNCAGCHPDQYTEWSGSPMSRGGVNRWVYDIFDGTGTSTGSQGFVYQRDSVHAAGNPNSECAACHQPQVWIERNGAAMDPIGSLSVGAQHGISCDVCHKIADIDETRTNFPGIWPGVVTFNRPASPLFDHQVQYGRLGDSSIDIGGVMRPSYQPQLAGAVCAACHQDKNDPDGDGDFEESNGVISEPTWLEWLASPYSDPNSPHHATCVDCHMPATNSPFACAMMHPQRPVGQVRSHRIEGTTPAYLENAVDLSTTVTHIGDRLRVDVAVNNHATGHHVPTGVTVRNMILLIDAWDVQSGARLTQVSGSTIHRIGGVGDPKRGYLAGLPGKVYAKHNHDATGNGPTFFSEATGILWDTRIPALNADNTSYEFSIAPSQGTIRVRARLVYRRAFRFLVDAKGWTADGHGRPLADVRAPYFGHLMEEDAWQGPGAGAVTHHGTSCRSLQIGFQGDPALGTTDFALTLQGASPNAPSLVALGFDASRWLGFTLPLDLTPIGAPGCWLATSMDVTRRADANASGAALLSLPIPMTAPAGATLHAQWLVADPTLPLGVALSDALAITIQR